MSTVSVFYKAVLFVWLEVVSAAAYVSERASLGLARPFVRCQCGDY